MTGRRTMLTAASAIGHDSGAIVGSKLRPSHALVLSNDYHRLSPTINFQFYNTHLDVNAADPGDVCML